VGRSRSPCASRCSRRGGCQDTRGELTLDARYRLADIVISPHHVCFYPQSRTLDSASKSAFAYRFMSTRTNIQIGQPRRSGAGVKPMNAPTNLDEYDAIANTVQYYTDGAKSGRGADMQPAFHQDATIFGYADGEIFAGPIQKLFESVDQDTPA